IVGDGAIGYWLTNIAIWVCALPPLFAAWRALAGPRRLAWFAALFVLPFVFVIGFGVVMESYVLLTLHVLEEPIYRIPMLLVLTEAVCLAIYWRLRADLSGAPAITRPASGYLEPFMLATAAARQNGRA